MAPTPQTPTAIHTYPASLSKASHGPSRPPRTYPTPSIDSDIASPPDALAPLHEYSSLQELLQKAGYKETRVYTPEAEKIRRNIKKTLDENEEEVDALYGTYGFDRGVQHAHQNVTEPIMPMKRSTSILRSLAVQAAARSAASVGSNGPDQSWWAAWGKNPKMSPPEPSTEVGLSLARNGDGVRKIKSTWELESGRTRRAETDSPLQEERPPLPSVRQVSSPQEMTSAIGYTPTKSTTKPLDKSIFSSPPPPPALPDDAFGYCPLPDDYEAQCAEDEALYAMGANDYDAYSLGSGSATPSIRSSFSGHSRTPSDDRAEREIRQFQDEMDGELLNEVNDVGQRLLAGAVEYDGESEDEEEQEPIRTWSLPKVMVETPSSGEAPTIPMPSPPKPVEAPRETPVEEVKKPLKYGDRAAKIRLAHSTPNLKKAETAPPALPSGWLGSIRNALLGPTSSTSSQIKVRPPHSLRVSTAAPAQPRLVTASPVLCDSVSTDAEDLPPVPSPTEGSSLLRYRPSLAKLRQTFLGNASAVEGDALVLSPRLDWKQQGEEFAGWSPMRRTGKAEAEVAQSTEDGEIDWSKSFFYKPSTPPRARAGEPETPKAKQSSSVSTGTVRGPRKQRSIKSLQAALLLPVAPTPAPPVPAIPSHLLSTPRRIPQLAIQSPQATTPRELVLDGDEFCPQSLTDSSRRGRGSSKRGNGVRRRKSKKKSGLREGAE
ncbi:hypothetical protein B9479_005804 [Cryptococcus floricola]|uniref:Uncharacterized protein n=1 Tax=Cryptococcus floricola TaxID=2591691 RepID=A0A5D3APZ7_9TREE|nr:hypothetical protein B9479_005804 [Cryptococcus floricola]